MIRSDYLPDCYKKDLDSNNYKILQINADVLSDIQSDLLILYDILDINSATGTTLDLYGKMYGQQRGLLNDTQYRYLIFLKIGEIFSTCEYESVMNVVYMMFGLEGNDVGDNDIEIEDGPEPASVVIKKLPISVLVNAGFSSRQAVQLIGSLMPAGVNISADNFEGTFEFDAADGVYDTEKGFADMEQTIGGFLGLLLGDDDNISILPI